MRLAKAEAKGSKDSKDSKDETGARTRTRTRIRLNVGIVESADTTRKTVGAVRPVVPEAETDQGVAPVIVMPATRRTDRRRYVTKRDLVKYGYTDECQACTQLASGMHNAKVPHDDRCRDRIDGRGR